MVDSDSRDGLGGCDGSQPQPHHDSNPQPQSDVQARGESESTI